MTPEERAAKIAEDEHWYDIDYMQVGPDGDEQRIDSIDRDVLRAEIAAAIRAAVEAERAETRQEYRVMLMSAAAIMRAKGQAYTADVITAIVESDKETAEVRPSYDVGM